MANSYRPNLAATGAWLRSDGDLRGGCQSAADVIETAAKAVAPVRTGHYLAAIHTEDGTGWDGRVAVDVVAGAEYSIIVEQRHHVLKRAAGAA